MFDYTEDREQQILDRIYYLLSNAEILQTRLVGEVTKTTSFHKDMNIADLRLEKPSYVAPVICVKLGQRVTQTVLQDSIQLPLKMLVVIDSSVSSTTQKNAEYFARRLRDNLTQVLLNNKHFGNMLMCEFNHFQLDPYANNKLAEVTWRTFIEIDYK